MCGRARCTLRPEDVGRTCGFQKPLSVVDAERYHPSYNVSPGSYMPVLRKENASEDGVVVQCMKWGLVPSFTRKNEKPDHFRMFNARSESVKEKSSFRRLIPSHNCVVAVEGFYEWKKDGQKKQPYYIYLQNERNMVFAALYDKWQNAEGDVLYTFTLLTTRSSKALGWLHDRMPVILGSEDAIKAWMDGLSSMTFEEITQPYEGSDLAWHAVTPAMGRVQFDGPECIKEVKIKPLRENQISDLFSKKDTSTKKASQAGGDCSIITIQNPNSADESGLKEQKELNSRVEQDAKDTREDSYCNDKEHVTEKFGSKRKHETETVRVDDPNECMKQGSFVNITSSYPDIQIGSKNNDQFYTQTKKNKSDAKGNRQQTLLSYFGRKES
eukprot:TRINITY_DN11938_c0_g1_i1.p1 TRINITY_DN11938_c0_g1~~TRINITY_DN11938_c0_g1_i1.p1  ORF type:complete len:384 (+),score=86.54 TRINITY_DN11938_c0_g1_i1:202-1353(+)